VLESIRVFKTFGGIHALEDVSLKVPAGSITGIVGPNGAGKSTLFNVLSGLMSPDGGEVRFSGEQVTGQPSHVLAHRGLVRTFQISRELGELTVLENLLLARPRQSGESMWNSLVSRGRIRDEEGCGVREARELLERVNLWRLADAPARALSGGQKKLLELCRALMLRPKAILLDEPASGVNPVLIAGLCAFIARLRDEEGITFAIVEHNMDLVAELCDPVYVLAEGKVLTTGTFAGVVADRRVMEAYLGGTR
jgi:ABC-type branched-subunit amino acid transport system ATPase component